MRPGSFEWPPPLPWDRAGHVRYGLVAIFSVCVGALEGDELWADNYQPNLGLTL